MKKLTLLLMVVLVMGCTASTVTVRDVVLLPEDRIYTVPAGQVIKVELDGEPLEMTFPTDMKLVHYSVLVRQEEDLNEAILRKKKAEKKEAQRTGILGSILGILGAITTAIVSYNKGKSKK